jgi:hypothetical protein
MRFSAASHAILESYLQGARMNTGCPPIQYP